jgi:TonB-dependent receptor
LAPDSNDDIAVFDLTSPINSETAVVEGIELAFQYHFTNGFGLLANTTFIDSNAEFDRNDISQKFALTGLSDTQNLILFYDRDNLQFRVAWNRRSDFLQSLTQSQSSEPTFVDQYDQIDINASYAITPSVSLFVEGINITEESVIKHGRFDNQLLLAQSPGARYSLGIRASF